MGSVVGLSEQVLFHWLFGKGFSASLGKWARELQEYLSISTHPPLCSPTIWGLRALGSSRGTSFMSLETSRMHHQHIQLAGSSLAPALHPLKGTERVTARCLSLVGSRIQGILFGGQVGIKEPAGVLLPQVTASADWESCWPRVGFLKVSSLCLTYNRPKHIFLWNEWSSFLWDLHAL